MTFWTGQLASSICILAKFQVMPQHMGSIFQKIRMMLAERIDSHPEMVEKPSGLRFRELQSGSGPNARVGQSVRVHYTGWLEQNGKRGKQFDSSLKRGEPFQFQLGFGRVIAGWEEGVEGMQVGSKRLLIVPAKLAYGSQAVGSIPANSNLVFEVELLDCKY